MKVLILFVCLLMSSTGFWFGKQQQPVRGAAVVAGESPAEELAASVIQNSHLKASVGVGEVVEDAEVSKFYEKGDENRDFEETFLDAMEYWEGLHKVSFINDSFEFVAYRKELRYLTGLDARDAIFYWDALCSLPELHSDDDMQGLAGVLIETIAFEDSNLAMELLVESPGNLVGDEFTMGILRVFVEEDPEFALSWVEEMRSALPDDSELGYAIEEILYEEGAIYEEQLVETSAIHESDDIFVLTPFDVISDDQAGYLASTITGCRIETNLQDVASAITVYTEAFLADIGKMDE